MLTQQTLPNLLAKLGFTEGAKKGVYNKSYSTGAYLSVDFISQTLIYPEDLGFKINERQTCNFKQNENFVVFECVDRLLSQGYKAEHIELEPKWKLGHGASGGRADILVRDYKKNTLLIIECKTAGTEFSKAWNKTLQDGGQLFSYVQQAGSTQFVCLYASDLSDEQVTCRYHLISLVDNDDLIKSLKDSSDDEVLLFSVAKSKNVEAIYQTWKQTYQYDYATKGLFERDISPYQIGKTKYNLDDLTLISSTDIQGKYHEFATILRQHNVSGRENAFDKLVNLFLCKIVDETNNPDNLRFNWKGISFDNAFDLQDRLQALYQYGMKQFLNEEVTYIKEQDVEHAFKFYKNDPDETQKAVKAMFRELKFFTNNDFAFIDVHNRNLFEQNSAVLLKIVKMLQDIRLKTDEENQFLGDMFEGFLDQGVKQSEGQFFTPMPIVRFVISALPIETIIEQSKTPPKAIDYACGAGHFLNEYAKYVSSALEHTKKDHLNDYYKNIHGIEKEYRLSKVAKVSAFMYGQDDISIIYADALAKNNKIKNNDYSVLVANPPYSVKGFLDTLQPTERKQFELTNSISEKNYANNNSIETFFIERAKQLLKTDGVAAIIVPSSILTKGKASSTSTSTNIYVATREILLKHFDIVAIAEFGSGTFGKTGTNTVTLFIRRKDTTAPTQANQYWQRVTDWFNNDGSKNTLFQDEYLLKKYCQYQDINIDDYKTLLLGKPSQALLGHDYFADYLKAFNSWSDIKNLKKRKSFQQLEKGKQQTELDKRLTQYLKNNEQDKLYYFILATLNSTSVVIIKSPSKNKDIKTFLGYEWSTAKGQEGIKYLGNAKISTDEVDEDSGEVALEEDDKRVLSNLYNLNNIHTPLYDPHNLHNKNKINTLIRQNFLGENVSIPESLSAYVTQAKLVDMLDFSVVDFNKAMSLTPKVSLDIDSQWDVVRIGDIAETSSGGTPKSDNTSFYQNGVIPWINSGEVKQGVIASTENYISQLGLDNSSAKIFPINTVLVAMYGATAGQVGLLAFEASTNQAICGILPSENYLPKYLFFYLATQLKNLLSLRMGVARLNLSQDIIKNFKIPLPPIPVQQEIIANCQKIDDEVEKAELDISQAQQKINELFKNSQKASVNAVRLNDNKSFFIGIGRRVLANEINDIPSDGGVPVFSANVKEPFGYIQKTLLNDFSLPSILWGIDGDWQVNYWQENMPFYPTDHCGVIQVKDSSVNARYLVWVLEQVGIKERFSRHHRASTERVKNLPLSVPDIEVQNQTVSKVFNLEQKIQQAQTIIDSASKRKQKIIESYL